jgi:hypothetical protein
MGKNKKLILSLCLLIFSIGFLFLFPKPVFGGIDSLVASVISWFLELICSFFGQLTAWIIGFIAKVAQYNDFGRTQVVNKGWEILRDLANMFFILGFLVIAFATVLKIEKYSYKRLLFPLLLMALLVNFSRTICLLVIDFAQVIMLSFVNAFKDIQSGNLAQLLGIESVITLKAGGVGGQLQQTGLSGWDLTLAWLLGTVMMFIALVVSSIILVILIMRIIAIWILLVLSPLAFILYIIPGGQRYVSIWQSKFINQVIIGPILAFFLWLAFYAVQQGNITQGIPMENFDTSVIRGGGSTSIEAAKPNVFASFIVGIGLLIGALLATRELGVAGASLAGKGIDWLRQRGVGTAKFFGKQTDMLLLKTTKGLGRQIGIGLEKIGLGGKLAEGLKSFKGVSFLSLAEAYMARRRLAEARRKEEIWRAAWPQTIFMDKIIDPGVWTKRIYNALYGSRKMEQLEEERKKYIEDAKKKEEEAEKKRKEADELTAAARALKEAAEQLKQKAQEDDDFIKRIQEGVATRDEMKAKLKELGMSQSEIDRLTIFGRLKDQTISLLQQRRDAYRAEAQEKENLANEKEKEIEPKVKEKIRNAEELESKAQSAHKKARELAEKISNIRHKIILKVPRERPWLESLETRRRVMEKKRDISLETNNEERLVIEKLKQGLAEKKADTIQAALEILAEINGFNTMLMDPFIQSKVKEYIKKQRDYQPGQLEHFEKNPVAPAYLQLAFRSFLEDFAGFSPIEAARTAQRIGKTASLAGNFSFDGMAFTNPLLGTTEWSKLKWEKNKIEIGDEWKEYIKARFIAMEPQERNRIMHMNSLITQGPTGKPGELHLGGKAILEIITTADINQFNRMKIDVIRALTDPHILSQIWKYVKEELPKEQEKIIKKAIAELLRLRG